MCSKCRWNAPASEGLATVTRAFFQAPQPQGFGSLAPAVCLLLGSTLIGRWTVFVIAAPAGGLGGGTGKRYVRYCFRRIMGERCFSLLVRCHRFMEKCVPSSQLTSTAL
jgi:hypothetical protein